MVADRTLKARITLFHPRISEAVRRLGQPGIDGFRPLIGPLIIVPDPTQLDGKPLIARRYIAREIGQEIKELIVPGWRHRGLQEELRGLTKNAGFT